MAGKVKKGFGTYLFILFLMLVAAALVVLLVMIFSPFSKVMGFQYIFYQDDYIEHNVTGGSSEEIFDLSSLEEIKVNCNYATISLERSDDTDKNMIKISNTIQGFASANANVEFVYKIYYEKDSNNNVMCIDVHEPEASTYFTKNVHISIILPEDNAVNLQNTSLNITNTEGDIFIGYRSNSNQKIALKGLNIKTNSGEVFLGESLTGNMKDFFVNSERGGMYATGNLSVSNSFAINSKSGTIRLNNLSLGDYIAKMILGNCQFSANNIVGNIELQIADGYFDVAKLVGDISGNNPAEQLTTSTINIREVEGNISFPFANASKINIGKISGGKVYINGTSGKVDIGELNNYAWIEMTSGSVNLTAKYDFEVKTTTGAITIDYIGESIANKVAVSTQTGIVKLTTNYLLPFTLKAYTSEGNVRNINNIMIEGFGSNFNLPLELNGGEKPIEISTNARIEVYFKEVA